MREAGDASPGEPGLASEGTGPACEEHSRWGVHLPHSDLLFKCLSPVLMVLDGRWTLGQISDEVPLGSSNTHQFVSCLLNCFPQASPTAC